MQEAADRGTDRIRGGRAGIQMGLGTDGHPPPGAGLRMEAHGAGGSAAANTDPQRRLLARRLLTTGVRSQLESAAPHR